MTSTLAPVAGIDIAKDHLDAALYPPGEARRFSNDRPGHTALLRWLARVGAGRIVFEATGPYHRLLARRLAEASLVFAMLNPRQVRRFAEATGRLAKTDRLDPLVLAHFGALLAPECPPTLRNARATRRTARRAAEPGQGSQRTTNRAQTLTLDLLKRQAALRLKHIARQIQAIDAQARTLVAATPQLARRLAILTSIPGLGEVTAIALIADMPELGTMDAKQAASLAGLAPIARQSGIRQGKSAIRGGRAQLRQALYRPALVAARFNPDLKASFKTLTAAGKPAKLALTAVMRRLGVLANALLRDDRTWTPKPT